MISSLRVSIAEAKKAHTTFKIKYVTVLVAAVVVMLAAMCRQPSPADAYSYPVSLEDIAARMRSNKDKNVQVSPPMHPSSSSSSSMADAVVADNTDAVFRKTALQVLLSSGLFDDISSSPATAAATAPGWTEQQAVQEGANRVATPCDIMHLRLLLLAMRATQVGFTHTYTSSRNDNDWRYRKWLTAF